MNTIKANQLAEQAILDGTISELQDYETITREVKYGHENSKIDLLLTGGGNNDVYVEVKSVTLLERNNGYFPDTITTRGQKHLRELIAMAATGKRAVLLFAVLHTGINNFAAAAHIDKDYADLLHEAMTQGVEVLVYKAAISPSNIQLAQKINFP